MPTLFFGIVVLALVLWGLNAYSKADPKYLAKVLRPAGGILAVGAAAFLLFRGHLEVAIPLGLTGLGLLGWGPFASTGWFQRTQKTPGQVSRVRAPRVEMELDHDSGTMRGRMIAGRHQGAALERLDVKTLAALLDEMDEESRALLVAYLDRRDPSWSEYAQGHAAAGRAAASSGKMTEQEAYQILGIEPGASADDITRAHRTLMKKLHPDQGGSTYLAARINEAKEILFRRHR
jgi:hypothetical protein